MSEKQNAEFIVDLHCGRCGFSKRITVDLDVDGVYTIPNKFCPNDLFQLSRSIVIHPKSESVVENEQTEDKTTVENSVPRPTRPVDVSKDRSDSSEKAGS